MVHEDDDDRRAMANLLDLDKYEKHEEVHAGFLDNIINLTEAIKGDYDKHIENGNSAADFTILEVGAGPGNLLTRKLGAFADNGCTVLINEYDEKSVSMLRERQRQGRFSPKLTILPHDDVIAWMERQLAEGKQGSINVIASNFAMHHLKPQELDTFFALAKKLLKPNGRILAGEEHLDHHLPGHENDPAYGINASGDNRAAIQVSYHGRIIKDAWQRGAIVLPGLEFLALVSGLKTTSKFFPDKSYRTDGGNNTQAVQALDRLVGELEAIRREGRYEATWEQIEPHAATEAAAAGSSPDAERGKVIKALQDLREELRKSPKAGLAEDAEVFDPHKNRKENVPGIDHKITLRQYAKIARKHGFTVDAEVTGVPLDSQKKFSDIVGRSRQGTSNPMGAVYTTSARPDGSRSL